jgi:hypothetical protein
LVCPTVSFGFAGGGEFEEKFKKMQDMYNKLRGDHLTLLKTSSGAWNDHFASFTYCGQSSTANHSF